MHLFTKLAFAALLENSGMRYKVAVQINTHLRTLPTQNTEHIPRLLHAEKLRLLSDPTLPQEEVQMLVTKLVARSPNVTTTMEGKVNGFWAGGTNEYTSHGWSRKRRTR